MRVLEWTCSVTGSLSFIWHQTCDFGKQTKVCWEAEIALGFYCLTLTDCCHILWSIKSFGQQNIWRATHALSHEPHTAKQVLILTISVEMSHTITNTYCDFHCKFIHCSDTWIGDSKFIFRSFLISSPNLFQFLFTPTAESRRQRVPAQICQWSKEMWGDGQETKWVMTSKFFFFIPSGKI